MAKQFLVTLDYGQFAVSGEDAVLLMQIASRAVKVRRPDYRSPYKPEVEQKPFVDMAELAEVLPADPVSPEVEPAPVPQLKEDLPF